MLSNPRGRLSEVKTDDCDENLPVLCGKQITVDRLERDVGVLAEETEEIKGCVPLFFEFNYCWYGKER